MALTNLEKHGARCFKENVDKQNANNLYLEELVGSTVNGIDYKDSVRVATTANITLSGAQTIDGVSAIAGDRVLVKDQSTAKNNGVYIVATSTWSRAGDADSSAEVTTGLTVFVEEGTANGSTTWTLNTAMPIVLGTTELSFAKIADQNATSTNTANKVVKRDASGNFAAGTITATLTGTASEATQIASASIFKSTEQTGSGEQQSIAHGLGSIPRVILVIPTEIGTDGGDIAEGTHTTTNILVTATSGLKYIVVCIK